MNLIVVSPHGRSGTIFIQSLFDAHPQVITFPTHKLNYPDWEVGMSAKECLVDFIKDNSHLFEGGAASIDGNELNLKSKFYKSGKLASPISVNYFVEACRTELGMSWSTSITRKDFVIGIHKAYARLRGYDVSAIKYLLFHLHGYRDRNHERALSDFPDMKFIAMARDPRETWLSSDREWARHNADAGIDYKTVRPLFFVRVMLRYKKAIQGLISFSKKLPADNVVVVDLNKFHELNRTAMTRLATWLDIEFTEALLESSFGGAAWLGNAADRKPISGFDVNKSRYKWPSELSDRDRDLINFLLAPEIMLLRYSYDALVKCPNVPLTFPHRAYLYLRWRELDVASRSLSKSKTGALRYLRAGSSIAVGIMAAMRDYVTLIRQVRNLNDTKANSEVLRISGWRLE